MGVDRDDPEVKRLLESQIPLIAVDLDVAGEHASYVASDNVGGARAAVRYLHSLGHRRIATIAGPQDTKPGADRLMGYRAELQALGIEARADYEQVGDFYSESGETAMRALLDLAKPPTAVFAAADLMAVGAINAANDAGVEVPGTSRSSASTTSSWPAPQPHADDDPAGQARPRPGGSAGPRRADRQPRDDAACVDAANRARRAGVVRRDVQSGGSDRGQGRRTSTTKQPNRNTVGTEGRSGGTFPCTAQPNRATRRPDRGDRDCLGPGGQRGVGVAAQQHHADRRRLR
jgi:hypothetical protein